MTIVHFSRGLPCHEFEPSTTKDPPCRAAMHVKSVESGNVLPLGSNGILDMPTQRDKPSNLGEKRGDMPTQRDKPSNLGV
ncbi:hypothetical protein TNCV_274591 [Trichonephila clavipes]|nr:hypothetical protein TNCV_274591 [Trichonephila clavipes]